MRQGKFFRLFLLTVLVCLSAKPLVALGTPLGELTLDNTDARYDINTSPHASGFFVAPESIALQEISDYIHKNDAHKDNALKDNALSDSAFSPDFLKSPRHWLTIPIYNHTDNVDWVLHVSTIMIDRVEVFLNDGLVPYSTVSDLSQGVNKELINVLGRGFPIHLAEQGHYVLALELSANRYLTPTYVGLMSQAYYDDWTSKLDYFYKIPLGIILGFVLIALMCGLVLWDATFIWFGVSSLLIFAAFFSRNYLVLDIFHVFKQHPPWIWILVPLAHLSVLFFVRSFLLVNSDPLIRLFNMTIVISAIVFAFGFFLPTRWLPMLYIINAIFIMGLTFYSGTIKMLKEGKYYILFILGWLPILISTIQFLIFRVANSAIPDSTISYSVIQESYIQVSHMAIHFLAMLIRILSLKKQKVEAETQQEAKSQFLAEASHDLRQPLHSMGMFLSHLKAHVDQENGQKIVDKMNSLHLLMSDSFAALMDLSRLEAGAVAVNKENIDLQSVIDKMQLEFEPDANLKGIQFRARRTTKVVHSDALMLDRILRNLISNAIKYTTEGGVLIGCRIRGSCLLLQVWDTGCGISTAEQPAIFDVYARTTAVKGDLDGIGVGLSNVKHLADLLGHPLSVFSRERSGSMFQVSLPIVECPNDNAVTVNNGTEQKSSLEQSSYQTSQQQASRLHIVVEISDPTLDEQVKATLHNWGYRYSSSIDQEKAATNQDQALTLILTDAERCKTDEEHCSQAHNANRKLTPKVTAFFADNITPQQTQQLKDVGVHALATDFRPAQLRSLIKYSELIASKNSHEVK